MTGTLSTKMMIEQLYSRVQLYTQELEQALQQARSADQAKNTFLAILSHELRTPLNSILGFSDLILKNPRTPVDIKERVEIIRASGAHLLDLTNDVLDFAKLEADRLEIIPRTVNLPALLDFVTEIIQPEVQKKGLDFYYVVRALPFWVLLDSTRLKQVLLNLLANAVKFTEQGEITFRAASSTAGQDIQLVFSVTDTGVGISSEDQDNLFHPFTRVGDHSRDQNGAGLGLAISQRLVNRMGGDIKVRSEPGMGSTFSFNITVPIADAPIRSKTRSSDVWQQPVGYCHVSPEGV